MYKTVSYSWHLTKVPIRGWKYIVVEKSGNFFFFFNFTGILLFFKTFSLIEEFHIIYFDCSSLLFFFSFEKKVLSGPVCVFKCSLEPGQPVRCHTSEKNAPSVSIHAHRASLRAGASWAPPNMLVPLSVLDLHKSWAYCHMCCGFLCATTLWCPEKFPCIHLIFGSDYLSSTEIPEPWEERVEYRCPI